jgi:prepilin-type N-terminal cleavage/methylation domain-containing protein
MKQTRKNGFTLIEMIIAIFILAIISITSVAAFRRGQARKNVNIAADTISTVLTNGQNFALSARQIENSTCYLGKAPKSYVAFFDHPDIVELYGIDKCDGINLVEKYSIPLKSRFHGDGFKIPDLKDPSTPLSIKFTPPFAEMTAAEGVNSRHRWFKAATLVVVSSEYAEIEAEIEIDAVSGRIGESFEEEEGGE